MLNAKTRFIADGEFGTEIVEADDIHEAARKTAEAHAGLDCDEICTEPFRFSITIEGDQNSFREYVSEWSLDDGLQVWDELSGDII